MLLYWDDLRVVDASTLKQGTTTNTPVCRTRAGKSRTRALVTSAVDRHSVCVLLMFWMFCSFVGVSQNETNASLLKICLKIDLVGLQQDGPTVGQQLCCPTPCCSREF